MKNLADFFVLYEASILHGIHFALDMAGSAGLGYGSWMPWILGGSRLLRLVTWCMYPISSLAEKGSTESGSRVLSGPNITHIDCSTWKSGWGGGMDSRT